MGHYDKYREEQAALECSRLRSSIEDPILRTVVAIRNELAELKAELLSIKEKLNENK